MPARLIKLAISIVIACLDWVQGCLRRVAGIKPEPVFIVIYYHAVRSPLRSRFAWQMRTLRALARPVAPDEVGRLPEGRRHAAVTFDDGFNSVVENALPELEALGIPCEIFVPTGSLGNRPRWISPAHADGREEVATEDIVRELAHRPLVRIGSHSVSHPDFRKLDDARAVEEFTASRQALERITGGPVKSFSFPHGAHTQRSLELARQCGYERAYTIEPRRVTGNAGFSIGRVRVEPHDWPIEFRLKVVGAYRWMVHASAIKRKLRSGASSELPAGA